MAELSFDDAAKELEGWAMSLLSIIESHVAQARSALEKGVPPNIDVPSRAAMAELYLLKIAERIGEVEGRYKTLVQAVYDHPSANRKD